MQEAQNLHVATKDVLLVVEIGRLGQVDAPTWLDFTVPIHKEALLAGGAKKAHEFLTNFVFLKAHSLSIIRAPFEIDEIGWEELIRRDIEAKFSFKRVIPIAWEAEAVMK